MKKRLFTLTVLMLAFAGCLRAQYEIYTNDGAMYFWEQQQLRVNESGPVSSWTLQTPKPILLSDVRDVVRGYTVLTVMVNSSPAMFDHRLQLAVGETATFTATVSPQNASIKDLTWTSSNPQVATVSNGLVTAVGEGSTTISVTANQGGYTVNCYIMVKGNNTVHVTNLTLSPTEMTLYVGDEGLITPNVTPENATVKDVTWSSSANNIATVKNGVVKALAVGTATITAKTIDGGVGKQSFKYATCRVTVKQKPAEEPDQPTLGIKLPGASSYEKLTASTWGLVGQHFSVKAFADKNLTRPLQGSYTVTPRGQGTIRYTASQSDVDLWGTYNIPEPVAFSFTSADGGTSVEGSTLFEINPAVVVATTTGVCVNGKMINNRNTVKLIYHPWNGVCELADINASTSESYMDGVKKYTYPGRADAFCFDDNGNMIAAVAEPANNSVNLNVYANNQRLLYLERMVNNGRLPSIWARGNTCNNGQPDRNGGLICTTTTGYNNLAGTAAPGWSASGWNFDSNNTLCPWVWESSYAQMGYYALLDNNISVCAVNTSTLPNATAYDPVNSMTSICMDGDPVCELGNARVWSDGRQILFTHYVAKDKTWLLGSLNENYQENTLCTRSFDPVPQMFAENLMGEWITAGTQNGTFKVFNGQGEIYFTTTTLNGKTINDFVLARTLPEGWYQLLK